MARRVVVGVRDGRLIATWSECGHEVPVNPPGAGQWIAIGNGDPCPVCEGDEIEAPKSE